MKLTKSLTLILAIIMTASIANAAITTSSSSGGSGSSSWQSIPQGREYYYNQDFQEGDHIWGYTSINNVPETLHIYTNSSGETHQWTDPQHINVRGNVRIGKEYNNYNWTLAQNPLSCDLWRYDDEGRFGMSWTFEIWEVAMGYQNTPVSSLNFNRGGFNASVSMFFEQRNTHIVDKETGEVTESVYTGGKGQIDGFIENAWVQEFGATIMDSSNWELDPFEPESLFIRFNVYGQYLGDTETFNQEVQLVPEPATLSLFAISTIALLRRKKF